MDKSIDEIEKLLEEVVDPEIPVLNIREIGMLRNILQDKLGNLIIQITPTYVGCPAMGAIEEDIEEKLNENQIENYSIETILSPAWTTDWITKEARAKLEQYGIAPPVGQTSDKSHLTGKKRIIKCPQCKSENTDMISQFGSTACKSLYKCLDCLEPFDYFKCF